MNIGILFESNGHTRRAFANAGHNVISCDLLPADDGATMRTHVGANIGRHWQGDVFEFIELMGAGFFDLLICHPPCTYLASSGLHWNHKVEGREEKTESALDMVRKVMALDVPLIAIENPVGCISTRIDATAYGFRTAKATQYIQPYDYGHDASKKTGLWLKGLPDIAPLEGDYVEPRIVINSKGKAMKRWANQTDSGQNALTPSPTRWKERSETYSGWSSAMVRAWANL